MGSALQIVQGFFPQVTEVKDAMRSARIEVKAEDAASKGIKNHKSCAMAVACKRAWHLDGVIISRTMVYLVKGKVARRFFMTPSATREVVSFDRGGGFAPGVYGLTAIPKNKRLGTYKGKGGKGGGHGL